MRRIYQARNAMKVFLITLTLSGCALIIGETDSDYQFDIVTVPSTHAHPEKIMITPTKSGLLITGEVHKKFHGPGHIRGHVDVELISSNGIVLAIGSTRYFHPGRMSRVFKFAIDIQVDRNEVKKVMVTHHAPAKENK